jgi:hypothetical protein
MRDGWRTVVADSGVVNTGLRVGQRRLVWVGDAGSNKLIQFGIVGGYPT